MARYHRRWQNTGLDLTDDWYQRLDDIHIQQMRLVVENKNQTVIKHGKQGPLPLPWMESSSIKQAVFLFTAIKSFGGETNVQVRSFMAAGPAEGMEMMIAELGSASASMLVA